VLAARPGRRAEIEELRVANAALRERLEMELNPDPDATFLTLAQDVRDALAVRALFVHTGDMYAALRQLGFDTKDRSIIDLRNMAKLVFDTEGVRAKMTANLEDFEGQRLAMIARQVQIALHGTDENATRAFGTLARTLGWQKTPDSTFNVDKRTVNVWQMFGEQDRARAGQAAIEGGGGTNGLDLLGYEPGAPTPIDVAEDLPENVVADDD